VTVGVVGLALIGVGQTVWNRHSIEEDLADRSARALASADLTMTADFSGRDATVSGSGSAADFARAVSVVEAVDGVRVAHPKTGATDAQPGSSAAPDAPTPPPATESARVPVGFTVSGRTITVTGTLPSKTEQTALIAATTAAGKDWKVVDRLTVDPALTTTSPAQSRFSAVTELLAQAPLDGDKLVIQYQPDSVILRGTPATPEAEKRLLTAAAPTVAADAAVIDGLDVPTS